MIRENLAELHFGRGRSDEARELLDAAAADLLALTKEPNSSMIVQHFRNLSEVFENIGETQRAEEVLRYAEGNGEPSRRDDPGPGDGPP